MRAVLPKAWIGWNFGLPDEMSTIYRGTSAGGKPGFSYAPSARRGSSGGVADGYRREQVTTGPSTLISPPPIAGPCLD